MIGEAVPEGYLVPDWLGFRTGAPTLPFLDDDGSEQ